MEAQPNHLHYLQSQNYWPHLPESLQTLTKTHRRQLFYSAIESGSKRPFLIPWSFLGTCILPVLYLSIPHRNRPWLWRARWVVAAVCCWLNWDLLQHQSAANEAVGYATGLLAGWGTIWMLSLVVFRDVQGGVARAVRVPISSSPTSREDGQRGAEKGQDRKEGTGQKMKGEPEVGFSSGHDEQNRKLEIRNRKDAESPSDEKSHGDEGEYEYKWQPYPSHAPFFVRLGWVASLYTSFRGAGWNFAISSLPAPPSALSGRVATDAIPLRSRSGYSISPSVRHFILTRLWHITWSWLLIDLFTLTMRYDPYMTLGPDWSSPSHPLYTSPSFSIKSPPPLPEFLTGLPPWVLGLARNVSAIGGIFAGLFLYSYLWQLVCFFCIHPSKEDLWRYPTLFGGFEQVYERGLQGFWGAWWHQTFRMGFTAPAEYLFSLLPPANDKKMTRAMVEMALAFLQSGILHACGGASAASLVPTNFWDPIWFFGMQGVGVLIQNILWQWQVVPKRGRIGNLVFVGVWLHFTGHKFIQDMARAGVWLFEPVPFSVLRWLGLGDQRESVWRWDEAYGFLWYWGKNFWERGLRVL